MDLSWIWTALVRLEHQAERALGFHPPPPSTPGGPHRMPDPSPDVPALNAALLAAAFDLLPDASSTLRPGDAAIDPVYGGRTGEAFGAPTWRYYQQKVGPSTSGGTTCGVALDFFMGRAGWPAEMVDRAADDAYGAPGHGFTPGKSVSDFVTGAKSRGWYRAGGAIDAAGNLAVQSSDAYHVDHPPKPNSDHVGVVVSVSEPASDGTRLVETADGGAESGAVVKRQTRTLSADGRTLTLNGVPARVLGVVRATTETAS